MLSNVAEKSNKKPIERTRKLNKKVMSQFKKLQELISELTKLRPTPECNFLLAN